MKTIAVSIDEPTLDALDRLAQNARLPSLAFGAGPRSARGVPGAARAVEQETRERAAIRRHRTLSGPPGEGPGRRAGRAVNRGEIYRTRDRAPERGHKPGFYVVVSRPFIAAHDDVSTVICAPVYGEVIGLATEVMVGPEEGIPRDSAIRCDFSPSCSSGSSPRSPAACRRSKSRS